jgi:1-acyl-sn-glycerol-3-phosphate acyltransferase
MRGCWKAIVLVVALCQCIAGFVFLRTRGRPSNRARAEWLQRSCKLVLARLGFGLGIEGTPPERGLVASNHLSYLDILFFGATLPCVFVAKVEVRSWPMLGLLAALGGTVFIDRRSAASAAAAANRIQELLVEGVPVLVFPEGTSSDGAEVLRFYSSLFEPAARTAAPVTAAAIGYSAGAGAVERDLCYYGDISFAPHLLETLRMPEITGTLRFARSGCIFEDRKKAALLTRAAVVELRSHPPRDRGIPDKA